VIAEDDERRPWIAFDDFERRRFVLGEEGLVCGANAENIWHATRH
jgi:hypothetical protein